MSNNQDVIELGSSEDETPAAKQVKKPRIIIVKKKTPKPNAMVSIPQSVKNHVIKVQAPKNKQTFNPQIEKIVSLRQNPFSGIVVKKSNPNNAQKSKCNPNVSFDKAIRLPTTIKVKDLCVNNTLATKYVAGGTILKGIPVIAPKSSSVKQFNFGNLPPGLTVRNLKPTIPPRLPPGLIVKKAPPQLLKRKNPVSPGKVVIKKIKKNPVAKSQDEVFTVDIDDEVSQSIVKAPQWYLKPEDDKEKSMEVVNNSEPETRTDNMIEIMIEDSPAKPSQYIEIEIEGTPVKDKQITKNMTEIVIEDSPITNITHRDEPGVTPKSLKNEENSKTVQSKKKLEFQKDSEHHVSTNGCSIQPKNDIIKPVKDSEFHPAYEEFIELCLKMEKSEDMNKIVEKKIKNYYKQVDKSFTNSQTFVYLVLDKIKSIKNDPDNMFLYIKDVVDELKMQKKMPQLKQCEELEKKEVAPGEPSTSKDAAADDEDTSENPNVRKLERTLRKLHRAIQKLEEQEVDFDDDTDSVYLLTEKYKARLIRVHAKLCQLTGTRLPSECKVKLEPRPNRPAGPTKRLEKWINRKVPVGAPLPFPDFHDVVRCVREANTEDNLGWNESMILEEARDLFSRCGRKLQRRRQQNEWRTASIWLKEENDPAEINTNLKEKLDENKKLAAQREQDIINKYADRQNQLKLEADEVNEDEIDKSDNEQESDEDIIFLEDKDGNECGGDNNVAEVKSDKSGKTIEESFNKCSNEVIPSVSQEVEVSVIEKEAIVDNSCGGVANVVVCASKEGAEKKSVIENTEHLHDSDSQHLELRLSEKESEAGDVCTVKTGSALASKITFQSSECNSESINISDVVSIEDTSSDTKQDKSGSDNDNEKNQSDNEESEAYNDKSDSDEIETIFMDSSDESNKATALKVNPKPAHDESLSDSSLLKNNDVNIIERIDDECQVNNEIETCVVDLEISENKRIANIEQDMEIGSTTVNGLELSPRLIEDSTS